MLLVGIFLPPLIEYINKDVKQDDQRFVVALIVCVIISIILHPEYLSSLEFSNLHVFAATVGQTFILIYAESSLVFKIYWQNSFARDKMQTLIGSSAQKE